MTANKTPDELSSEQATAELEDTLDLHNDALEAEEQTDSPDDAFSSHFPAYKPQGLELDKILEAALLTVGQPLNLQKLLGLFDEEVAPAKEEVLASLERIAAACADRGFELMEIASGWRFQVRKETAPWVNRLFDEKPQRYSRALLETLALIAYRQPITRGDIEEIRGVAVSSHIMKTLIEREWVKVVGHRDVPGRPSLYATTRQFLDYFNLASLDQLPSLGEISDLENMTPELDLVSPGETPDTAASESESTEIAESAEPDVLAADSVSVEDQESGDLSGNVLSADGLTEDEEAPAELAMGEDEPPQILDDSAEHSVSEALGGDLPEADDAGVDTTGTAEKETDESQKKSKQYNDLNSLFKD